MPDKPRLCCKIALKIEGFFFVCAVHLRRKKRWKCELFSELKCLQSMSTVQTGGIEKYLYKMKTIAFFSMFSSLVWLKQHNVAQVCPNGPAGGSLRISATISPKLQLFIIKPRTATLRIGLPCEISAPHWTTLGGQSNSMALETPGTFFFFFPKRSCSCFARAGGGEGKTSALAFMERRPARTKSSPKREALVGDWEREQRRLPQTRNTHSHTHTHSHKNTANVF